MLISLFRLPVELFVLLLCFFVRKGEQNATSLYSPWLRLHINIARSITSLLYFDVFWECLASFHPPNFYPCMLFFIRQLRYLEHQDIFVIIQAKLLSLLVHLNVILSADFLYIHYNCYIPFTRKFGISKKLYRRNFINTLSHTHTHTHTYVWTIKKICISSLNCIFLHISYLFSTSLNKMYDVLLKFKQ